MKPIENIMTTIFMLLCSFTLATAHPPTLQVSIAQSGTSANSCTRTLSAHVTGGYGNYSYVWAIATPNIPFPGNNTLQTIQVSLSETTDFIVTVTDNISAAQSSTSVTVHRILDGPFSVFIPTVITPNGDGVNDHWIIMDSPKLGGPLNAHSYTLTIKNGSNTTVYSANSTVTSNHVGLLGGDIHWNARINGTGSIVAVGSYTYSIVLVNCSQSTTHNGVLYVF